MPSADIHPCPDHFPEAEKLTWHIGTPDDRRWRSVKFLKLPLSFQTAVARTYTRIYFVAGLQSANLYLAEVTDRFDSLSAKLISEPSELDKYARTKAKACTRICATTSSETKAFSRIVDTKLELGILPPIIEGSISVAGALRRLESEQWWRKKLHRHCLEAFEKSAIHCGLTHSKAGLYVSDAGFQLVISKRIRNQDILNSLTAINELGEEFALADLVSSSISNPQNRRNELMARLFGFDVIAKKFNHAGLFVTLTCPSRMHARLKATGDCNPKYDLSSPRESQQYLCLLWSRIRAAFSNTDIHIYGFRVAEPQHDATPHWHILLYSRSENIPQIKDIFTKYALADSPDERGAAKNIVTFIDIDWTKGSGVGYIAKYISKNIDGVHLDKDLEGNCAEINAKRVSAWASVHGIRQFQQLGGPTVTSWRELRRIASAPEGLLSEAREAADSGNWELFTEKLGGIDCPRREQALKLVHIHDDEPGIYGEPKGDSILGVTDGKQLAVTREHSWTIQKAAKATCSPNEVG